jgi:hypothetical protein
MKPQTKADMQREIDRLKQELRIERDRYHKTHAELSEANEQLEKAEMKGEKSRFAQKWHKRLAKLLGLDVLEDPSWDEIEGAIATLREGADAFEGLPFTVDDGPALAKLFDSLGISDQALQYALSSEDPAAALKSWS